MCAVKFKSFSHVRSRDFLCFKNALGSFIRANFG